MLSVHNLCMQDGRWIFDFAIIIASYIYCNNVYMYIYMYIYDVVFMYYTYMWVYLYIFRLVNVHIHAGVWVRINDLHCPRSFVKSSAPFSVACTAQCG